MHDSYASNNYVNVLVSLCKINLHPNKIEWPWWLTLKKGANDILFVGEICGVKCDDVPKTFVTYPTSQICPKYIL